MKYVLFTIALLAAESAFAGFETSPEWLAVGHYQPSGKGFESTIDSTNFFLSPDGKTNPADELDAAIALFQSNDDKTKCLFPSRYKLLKKNGLIDYDFPQCPDLEKFYDDLRPAGVTLLFTDAYMNNPSSLFGHTLLRIDTARQGTQLLAHGANYGAYTEGEEGSLLFAIYGLTGGYYGGFTIKPYYDVINTYNNIENRDIWELNLDLTPEELDFMVAHLWEVGHSQSRYFFFTRNCSYMLMETLDAVRPSLQLAQKFKLQTLPLDTIKAVERTPGLVKSTNYRPSRQAKIRHRYKQMNPKEQAAYLQSIRKNDYKLDGFDDNQKADILETAYQFTQYQYVAKKTELKEYRSQSFKILKERSQLKEKGSVKELQKGHNPLKTHEAMRATAGAGVRNGEGFQEISYRPAYHSLTDDNYGFLRGAEINFLNTTVRHYDNQDKYVLQQFDLVGIKSLAPVDEMFTPLSFQILANISREMNPQTEKEGYVFNFTVGSGGTVAVTDNIWAYLLVNTHVAYGGFLPHDQWAGLGAVVGLYADFDKVRVLGEVEKIYATSRLVPLMKYKAEAVYTLSRNNALALSYLYVQNYGKDVDESMVSLRHYF